MYFSSYNFLFTETLEKRFVRMEHNGTLADNLTYVFTMWQGWTAKQGDSIYFYFSAEKKPYCNNFNRENNNKDHIKSSLNRVSLIISNFKNLYFLNQIRIKTSYYIYESVVFKKLKKICIFQNLNHKRGIFKLSLKYILPFQFQCRKSSQLNKTVGLCSR